VDVALDAPRDDLALGMMSLGMREQR